MNIMKKLLFMAVAFSLALAGCKEDKKFTVTFDSNGGSAVAIQTVMEGEKVTKPADPTNEDYDFYGWYYMYDNISGHKWDFEVNTVTTNITLFARWTEPVYVVTTFAGNGVSGYTDGTGTAARFYYPAGIAIDKAGDLYVADESSHRIRKVTPDGVVTTFAGSSGFSGTTDGLVTAARFHIPTGLAFDATGNLYVADHYNHRIRKITPEGMVSTIAGSTLGYADGVGSNARFYYPFNLAVDAAGNVYVADTYNHLIRKITPDGTVTTLAGSTQGYADGTGSAAQFSRPMDIAIDAMGNLYVTDDWNHRIRKITPSGVVTTLAGSTLGHTDGIGTAAQFNYPVGITIDAAGNLYVTEAYNHCIRKITPTGVVTTIAGSGSAGLVNGIGTEARFSEPYGIAIDVLGNLYVADFRNHTIRKIVKE